MGGMHYIVQKYYKLDILKPYLWVDYQIEDVDNTWIKYPENNLQLKLDYSSISKKFTFNDVENIYEDIVKTNKIFQILNIILT